MRTESRTRRQIDANKLDLAVFNLIGDLDRFGIEHRQDDAREMASIVDGLRHRIRRHMHTNDREATI